MTDFDEAKESMVGLRDVFEIALPEYDFGDAVPAFQIGDETATYLLQPRVTDGHLVIECSAFDCHGKARMHLHLNAGPCSD